METTISKWGNSLGVRLPSDIVKEHKLKAGSRVRITSDSKVVSIKPVKKGEMSLDELISNITPENRHDSVWANVKPVGKEIW